MIFGLLIMVLFILLELLIYRDLFSPIVMFTGLFLMILVLALQKRFGMLEFDDRAVLLIEAGVISFSLGVFLIRLVLTSMTKGRNNIPSVIELRWRLIIPLTVIITFANFFVFAYAIKFLLNGGNYGQLRASLLGYEGENTNVMVISPIVGILSSYVGPCLYALLPIAIWLFIKRKHLKFSTIVFLNLLLNVIVTGSRIILIYTVIQFMAVMSYERIHISRKVKKTVIFLIVTAFIGVVFLSNVRSSNGIFHSFYTYFSAPVVLFSYWINYVDACNIHSYGLSFIYPFTWLINAGGNLLGLNFEILRNVVEWQSLPQDNWVNVFPPQSMNAFSTLFYFFYEDFRYVGVCLFSFIFGTITSWVYCRAFIKKSTKYLIFYLLGIKAIIGSFMIWQLGSTSFFLSFVLLLLMIRKEKIKRENIL